MSSVPTLRRHAIGLGAIVALLGASMAQAADPVDPQAQYKKEVEICNSGQSKQDKPTCLREANNALEESKRQKLDNGQSPQALRANALARCDSQPPADRGSCRALIEGAGTASGTPETGGVYRELVQREVVKPAPPQPAPKPAN